ncbi:phage tail assembly protein T [Piscirickettsia salmonis]|uniref:phage tail assembly protein T n=1 Tax=Piscirickettsia salmonis TaxID=1238 RepID=UPI001EE18EC8|nr:DUF4035 domain-containing protein [Piscirickettsia salmonis]
MNQLSQELSLSEFNEWLAYYSLEPFGVEKDDHRTALMVSAVVNGPLQRKDKTLFTPNDFMPNYSAGDEKKHKARQTWPLFYPQLQKGSKRWQQSVLSLLI